MDKLIPTYLLIIDEELSSELQVDAVSMVDAPAIERNFLQFTKDEIVTNCNGLRSEIFAEDQLHYTIDGVLWTGPTHKNADGRLMTGEVHDEQSQYLYHEGDAGVEWATKKLQQIDKAKEKLSSHLSFAINEDKQEIFGPAMLADVPIYRNDSQLGEYNVVFDKATIYKIAQKFFEKDFNKNFNLMHDPNQKCKGVYAFQSYIVDSTEGRPAPKGYEDAKDGSWFLGVKVNNAEVWSKIKSGEIKGFSVEGVFEYKKKEFTTDENVKCSNCNHSWDTSDSNEADKYVCHNCGFDNSAEQLYNKIQKLLEEVDS